MPPATQTGIHRVWYKAAQGTFLASQEAERLMELIEKINHILEEKKSVSSSHGMALQTSRTARNARSGSDQVTP
jgi:hypothetical protein